ncbi:Hypothetical protein A7982_07525 [Minicystis rosea]|nr:Hypothetical protein A7982_07525 [Minicystis rosea]
MPKIAEQVARAREALESTAGGATQQALGAWIDLVATWNARVDLTAARNDDELVDLMRERARARAGRETHHEMVSSRRFGAARGRPRSTFARGRAIRGAVVHGRPTNLATALGPCEPPSPRRGHG